MGKLQYGVITAAVHIAVCCVLTQVDDLYDFSLLFKFSTLQRSWNYKYNIIIIIIILISCKIKLKILILEIDKFFWWTEFPYLVALFIPSRSGGSFLRG
jgi:hypothetical protein